MIVEGEDELICDFAEYYHIYNYTALPVVYAAKLAVGLRETSRIKMKLAGENGTYEQKLMTLMYDCVNVIRYFHTQDAYDNINHPKSLYNQIFGDKDDAEQPSGDFHGFDSGDDFRKFWNS